VGNVAAETKVRKLSNSGLQAVAFRVSFGRNPYVFASAIFEVSLHIFPSGFSGNPNVLWDYSTMWTAECESRSRPPTN